MAAMPPPPQPLRRATGAPVLKAQQVQAHLERHLGAYHERLEPRPEAGRLRLEAAHDGLVHRLQLLAVAGVHHARQRCHERLLLGHAAVRLRYGTQMPLYRCRPHAGSLLWPLQRPVIALPHYSVARASTRMFAGCFRAEDSGSLPPLLLRAVVPQAGCAILVPLRAPPHPPWTGAVPCSRASSRLTSCVLLEPLARRPASPSPPLNSLPSGALQGQPHARAQ